MKAIEGWVDILMGEICKITTGKKDVNEGDPEGIYPFFTCSRTSSSSNSYSFDTDALLIAGNGEVGNLHRYKGKFEAYQRTYVLSSFSENIDYIFQYVGAFLKENLIRGHVGSTIPFIKLLDLTNFPIHLPTLKSEQTKIAEVLSTLDRLIEQTEALIDKQQSIKTGLMQDLLTYGIDEYGNIRSEQTHKFKDSPLGRIPVDWEVVSIFSVLAQPPKNGYSPVESNDWNGIYMLGLGCLTAEGFKPNQLKFAPKADRFIEATLLSHGDFLISRSNTRALVGMVGIFRDIGEPCIYPDLMIRLIFGSNVSVDYMEQVFMSPVIRRQIVNAATGTSGSMVKIRATVFKEVLFSKPPLEEQISILSVLQSGSGGIRETIAFLKKLRSLKTALMQDLLTGRKRVTPLLNETEVVS